MCDIGYLGDVFGSGYLALGNIWALLGFGDSLGHLELGKTWVSKPIIFQVPSRAWIHFRIIWNCLRIFPNYWKYFEKFCKYGKFQVSEEERRGAKQIYILTVISKPVMIYIGNVIFAKFRQTFASEGWPRTDTILVN